MISGETAGPYGTFYDNMPIDGFPLVQDPKTHKKIREVEVDQLPWEHEDFATDAVFLATGMSSEMTDLLAPEGRLYWASLIHAVAGCNLQGPNGEVNTMSKAEIKALIETAKASRLGETRFLQEFGHIARVERFEQRTHNKPHTDPDKFFALIATRTAKAAIES